MAQKSIVSSSFSSSLSSFSMSLFPIFFTHAFREHHPRKENMSSIVANVRCLRKPLDDSNVPTHSTSENFRKWKNKKDAQRHIVIIICHFIYLFIFFFKLKKKLCLGALLSVRLFSSCKFACRGVSLTELAPSTHWGSCFSSWWSTLTHKIYFVCVCVCV
jgi:hypothetical protein